MQHLVHDGAECRRPGKWGAAERLVACRLGVLEASGGERECGFETGGGERHGGGVHLAAGAREGLGRQRLELLLRRLAEDDPRLLELGRNAGGNLPRVPRARVNRVDRGGKAGAEE